MYPTIFYDLETTDLNYIGQIVDYAFVLVDPAWNILRECSGKIRVNRLQIPTIGAVLATNLDIREHQRTTRKTEKDALDEIAKFIRGALDEYPNGVNLMGYNSSKFDLHFLRTSMTRNGINPYFGKALHNRDVLHGIKKLMVVPDGKFWERIWDSTPNKFPSLTLDNITKRLDISISDQLHTARDDVRLTIALAECLLDEFGFDVRTYRCYEPTVHSQDTVVKQLVINPDREQTNYVYSRPMGYLMSDQNHALWLDIEAAKKPDTDIKSAIYWFSKQGTQFVLGDTVTDSDFRTLDYSQYLPTSFKTFFPERDCDIEQHIYKLSFRALDALTDIIWHKDPGPYRNLHSRDKLHVKTLARRYALARSTAIDTDFIKYAQYRYGGELKLSDTTTHPTLFEMLVEAEQLLLDDTTSIEHRQLLESWKTFCLSSDIYKALTLEENIKCDNLFST